MPRLRERRWRPDALVLVLGSAALTLFAAGAMVRVPGFRPEPLGTRQTQPPLRDVSPSLAAQSYFTELLAGRAHRAQQVAGGPADRQAVSALGDRLATLGADLEAPASFVVDETRWEKAGTRVVLEGVLEPLSGGSPLGAAEVELGRRGERWRVRHVTFTPPPAATAGAEP